MNKDYFVEGDRLKIRLENWPWISRVEVLFIPKTMSDLYKLRDLDIGQVIYTRLFSVIEFILEA